jgi:hypothetical protein
MAATVDPNVKRSRVGEAVEYGNAANFWVEYPSGLIDLTSTTHLDPSGAEPQPRPGQWDVVCDGERRIRADPKSSALVVIDMQKYVLSHAGTCRIYNLDNLVFSCIRIAEIILRDLRVSSL